MEDYELVHRPTYDSAKLRFENAFGVTEMFNFVGFDNTTPGTKHRPNISDPNTYYQPCVVTYFAG